MAISATEALQLVRNLLGVVDQTNCAFSLYFYARHGYVLIFAIYGICLRLRVGGN